MIHDIAYAKAREFGERPPISRQNYDHIAESCT